LVAATIGIAFTLPDMYQSTVTVLVDHPQVTGDFATQAASAAKLETKLRTIMQRILSRSALYDLAIRFDVCPELRSRGTEEEVVARVRRDIGMEPQEIWGMACWRTATTALNLRSVGANPGSSRQVTTPL